MIQDIGNHVFDNAFAQHQACDGDLVLAYDGWSALANLSGSTPIPAAETACRALEMKLEDLVYAFSIDETRFFIAPLWNRFSEPDAKLIAECGLAFENIHLIMNLDDNCWKFAFVTGLHLARWYADNHFCPRCGTPFTNSSDERALVCLRCGYHVYPRINPAIIVAVTDGDRILMTRYKNRPYVQRALIAGFCEIGERAEDTVRREVLEEAGVRVKNIRYVSNQPWGLSGDMLFGFTAELDGSDEIHMDTDELKSAEWVHRDDIFEEEDNLSLTRDLVMMFKRGEL